MTIAITRINEQFAVTGQVLTEHMAEIAAMGFRSIINNRPDGESADQPPQAALQAAAEASGLAYAYLPVIPSNIDQNAIQKMSEYLQNMPSPILGFCRTGNRASKLYQAAGQLG